MMQSITSLGPKGIAFLVCCVADIVMGILICFGDTFGIVVGILAILLGLCGCYSSIARDLRGLFIYFWSALVMVLLCAILMLVLFLGYHTFNDVPYVGALIIIPVCIISAYLAYDGRGKTLAWTVIAGSSAPAQQSTA